MSPRKVHLLVSDIQRAIGRLQKLTAGMQYEGFLADETRIEAVLFNFAIIGEAASKIPKITRDRHSRIPWNQMIGMRNVVIHEYFRVDIEILWNSILMRLPELSELLPALLNSSEEDPGKEKKKTVKKRRK